MIENKLSRNSGLWKQEFGEEFAVPETIAAEMIDQSWHNDACPSFTMMYPTDVVPTLYVNHPDPAKREGFDERYCVTVNGDDVLVTDDVSEAVTWIKFHTQHYGHDVTGSMRAGYVSVCWDCDEELKAHNGR